MKADRKTHILVEDPANPPPGVNPEDLTDKFNSIAIIINPEKSEIAKKLGAKMPGKYAIKVK